MVAWRAASGTTGIDVSRPARAGSSSRRMADSTSVMPSMALTPRNGMLPCAIRPTSVNSNQYTPRWPTADAVDVQRLRNDDVVGPRLRDAALLREPRHTGKAAALFVHRAADLERPRQRHARARDRFRRVHGRGEPRFHVAHAAAEDPAVTHHAGEWIERPPIAGRHDIDVPVQVDDRSAAAPARGDDVDAGVTGRMLGPAVGDDVLDVEPALPQVIAEKAGARLVLVARWIDCRNPHEIHRELRRSRRRRDRLPPECGR